MQKIFLDAAEQVDHDARVLGELPPPALRLTGDASDELWAVIDYLGAICKAVGSAVLIVDQAEEFLGSGHFQRDRRMEGDAQRVLGAVFDQEKRVKLLVSLREEYVGRLNQLESMVGGLDGRRYTLEPMKQSTATGMIGQSSATAGITVDESVGETLVSWAAEDPEEEGAGVNLLNLQAMLMELWAFCKGNPSWADSRMIGPDDLAGFRASCKDAKDGRDIATDSLRRWIDRLFTAPPGTGLVRRAASRMAPLLSSPAGFKRQVTAAELVLGTIQEDLSLLAGSAVDAGYEDRLAKAITSFVTSDGKRSTDLRAIFSGNRSAAALCGDAVASNPAWSVADTAVRLVERTTAAISILRDPGNNVLKEVQLAGLEARMYELVHDGLGPALTLWGTKVRLSADDTLVRVVASHGTSFPWRELAGREAKYLKWMGCNLLGARLANMHFENCSFSGTVFSSCTMEDCTFRNCDLAGCGFMGGGWKNVIVEGGRAPSLLLMSVTLDNVTFRQVSAENTTWAKCKNISSVTLEQCSFRFSQIYKPKDSGSMKVAGCDLTNALLEAADEAQLRAAGCVLTNWTGVVPPEWKCV
jgi:hypothetical protein